jgi:FlaA1/EpsC-like NDP-sugar epimerase
LSTILNHRNDVKKKRVVIYGAGKAGVQLARSLMIDERYSLIYFVDDNKALWDRNLFGVDIKNSITLNRLEKDIDILFFCIPSINLKKRRELLTKLNQLSFDVLIVPTIEDLESGKAKIYETRKIRIEDIVYRETASINKSDLRETFLNNVILITGAGGTIGSELCRQILTFNPKKIILMDISEVSLYKISQELIQLNSNKIEILQVLGDCSDTEITRELFKTQNLDIVIHSAAYKHVPLVENNPLVGMSNNVLSTNTICKLSNEFDLKKVILISSDKAVRPTNIMGASKRIAELIFKAAQKTSNEKRNKTKFAAVRFGNVLNSSGSVVPLFKKQIKNGGPVTVTHPEIIRYFMTIEESVMLVLQSASMCKGGELFILDMGKPVKIKDLATKMINLSGFKVKDNDNPNGDIEIKYAGLREGEKLYEELLIDGKSVQSKHKLIYKDLESNNIINANSEMLLEDLKNTLSQKDINAALTLTKKIIPEWEQSSYIKSKKN